MAARTGAAPANVLVVLLVIAIGLVPLTCRDRWEEEHAHSPSVRDHPECPVSWGDSIPWFEYKQPALGALGVVTNVTYQPIPGGVPGTGPITDIPEFHDCQRFVSRDEQRFDSLFAIFASAKQDSITTALAWDSVTWAAVPPGVVTVSPQGVISGVAVGTAVITATSTVNQAITISKQVAVVAPGVTPTNQPIHMGTPDVDTIAPQESRRAFAPLGAPTDSTLPVATIYSYGQFYPELGIEPNFNCVYIFFDGTRRLRARVVPVRDLGGAVDACAQVFDLSRPGGSPLPVTVTSIGLATKSTDVPAVARWDWDPSPAPAGKKQFFGLGCGRVYCEVGVTESPGLHFLPPGSPAGDQRVVTIKPWHDEQVLAIPDPASEDGQLPSSLRATVIPNPDLEAQQWNEDGPSEWKTAAYIAIKDLSGGASSTTAQINHYRETLNIDFAPIGPLKEMNEMSYCFGRAWHCGSWLLVFRAVRCDFFATFGRRWWVRITPAPGSAVLNDPETYCLVRRTHAPPPGTTAPIDIPSTSRWRWILRDDTVWTECMAGCCETQGGW